MTFDFRYIAQYISSYDTGVPTAVIICVSVLVCAAVLGLFLVSTDYSTFVRQASFCLFFGYMFLVLCTTVFFREDTYQRRYMLQPLLTYKNLYSRRVAEIIMNVIMFIPIGFFVGGALKKKHVWNVIGIGIMLSFFIELTQLVSTRGVFSVDDIIHNTLGGVIGFLCFVLCYKCIRRFV